MIYWPAVVGAMQRRRWAARLERAAPERLTVAAAADILHLDREHKHVIERAFQVSPDVREPWHG